MFESVLDGINSKVTPEMNRDLTRHFTKEDVEAALRGFNLSKAFGPYGFPVSFYKKENIGVLLGRTS